jgi:hypothetical protein
MRNLKLPRTVVKKLGFSGIAAIASFVISGILLYSAKSILDREGRMPSSQNPLELQINKISLPVGSHFKEFNKVFLRVSFGEQPKDSMEFFREEPISLSQNESANLNLNLDLRNKWIESDKTVFRIEVIELGYVEQVVLRCTTATLELSSFNRSFTCSHPNESEPILSYRIGTKGSLAPSTKPAIASNYR